MASLLELETQVSGELGLHAVNEKTEIDVAINQAVQRVLEDTHCFVERTDYSGTWDGSGDFTLDAGVLEIVELQLTSTGTEYAFERLSVIDLLERRRVGRPTGSPTCYYALTGANLLMLYPAPEASDVLTVYNVPVPTPLSAPTDDPSDVTSGVPSILHEAIFLYACSKLASGDDDQTSAQGQRYRDWYKEEITRYHLILRKRGGSRNARVVVNAKRRRHAYHDNSVYPQ